MANGGNWVEIGNTVLQWFSTIAQTGAQMGFWGDGGGSARPPLGYEQYYSTPQQQPTQAGFGNNTTTLLIVGVGLYLLLKK